MKVANLAFGASSLGGVFRSIREDEGIRAVHTAVDNGINFIDVSPYYGHLKAETVLGKALREIPREKYYLSTKVGRYGKDGVNTWDYSAERATLSVYESMERLGVDYIDLINVHDIEFQASLPGGLQKVCDETLPALVALKKKGVVGHVGITDLQPESSGQRHAFTKGLYARLKESERSNRSVICNSCSSHSTLTRFLGWVK